MQSQKISAGSEFPELPALDLQGNQQEIGQPTSSDKWRIVLVYRGKHCPLCTKYLNI